jgi:exonuclease SbcC
MELQRLRLVNFRQHAATDIEFGKGVTGIVGPNGSGKTTLLEAIAWALYGAQAARGDKDSIRRLGAKGRAAVEVELWFRLGAHEYHVTRRLHDAELRQDGQLVANSLTAVTEKLGRALGMTHEEFFNTYFTGQKQLAVMATLKRTERAAFLSQVLGYERLRLAQDRVREVRNALAGELRGFEAGLPDAAGLAIERRAAEERLAAARAATQAAEAARQGAQEEMGREEPRWQQWVARRDRTLSLDGDRRVAEHQVEAAKQEFQRLDRELHQALEAQEQLKRLGVELAPIAALKRELVKLEKLQREAQVRREAQAQRDELGRTIAQMERRLAELEGAAKRLARAEQEAVELEQRLAAAEDAVEAERTSWIRDKTDAERQRLTLRDQFLDVKQQRDLIVKLGPAGTCPTCKRPLGAEYEAVLEILNRQLEEITINGNFYKQRMDQLAESPAALREAEAVRDSLLAERAQAGERAGQLRAEAEERARAGTQLDGARRRASELDAQVRSGRVTYDEARHVEVRAELAKLEPVALEAATLERLAQRAEGLVSDAESAEKELTLREQRAKDLGAAISAEGFSEERFKTAKQRYERALGTLKEKEIALVEARGTLTRAEADVRDAEKREAERATRERQIGALRGRQRLHNELDRAFSDLRAELNARMRPEIAELASGFLADLTDGRYDAVDLTEDYTVTVLDGGIPKPVISGGEEDLAALVLRLAISQMIAERAGQPLSLLVLDEIFGSLDEARRTHVLGLLRRLADRFPQVVLITHIEQVREGLDRVIRVEYDPAAGISSVRDDTATLGGADAGVAA